VQEHYSTTAIPPAGAPAPAAPAVPADLAPHHYSMLTAGSGIAPALLAARGYRTVTRKADLVALGFTRWQCRVPALLVPVYNPYGELVLYQARPDLPRIKDGHAVKYDTPPGTTMALDVPPTAANRQALRDPQLPLWITEGVKKGDALVSVGACAIALLGVWNWRGTNEVGGKTVLADFEAIALQGRQVFLAYDSDVMLKPAVAQALRRLSAWLTSRSVQVAYVYLPSGDGGSKQGVDDFLAQGHTLADLVALATATRRPLPAAEPAGPCPYAATPHGLVLHRATPTGTVTRPLTNFTATICTDIVTDDGVEQTRQLELEARLGGQTRRFTIPAAAFAGMTWAVDHLGAGAILMPGVTLKDHCRAAIQMLSTQMTARTVYTHSGWRQIQGQWCYLHGGGALGAAGPMPDVEVRLRADLAHYVLPPPPTGAAEQEAMRTSLGLLAVAPDAVSLPVYMAIWRAVLGPADFSVYLVGPTGVGKSALAALMQQHFGAGMDARHLPGTWTSTANALGELLFLAKDALCTLDDFCPSGSQPEQLRLHRDAATLLRNQGNTAGRQRLRPDGSLRPTKPPRGLVLATGEDVPQGQSVQARLLLLDLDATTVDWETLSRCQQHAAAGTYAAALAGFLRWLAPQYATVQATLPHAVPTLRQQAYQAGHRRTADIAAHLLYGWQTFLAYASATGALTAAEREMYERRGQQALATVAAAQAALHRSTNPVERFQALLQAVLSSGQAHLADKETQHVPVVDAAQYGWQRRGTPSRPADPATPWESPPPAADAWWPQGPRLGWVDREYLYLIPDATYSAITRLARDQGEPFPVTQRTLWKRLDEHGGLVREAGQRHYSVRVTMPGGRQRILQMPRDFYAETSGPSGPSDAEAPIGKAFDADHTPPPSPVSGPSGPERLPETAGEAHVDDASGLGPAQCSTAPEHEGPETPDDPHPLSPPGGLQRTPPVPRYSYGETSGPSGPSGPEHPSEQGGQDHWDHSRDPAPAQWSAAPERDALETPDDRRPRTTWTTWTTFASLSPQPPGRCCPHCRSQRVEGVGVYRLCVACGHKWQGDDHRPTGPTAPAP